MTERARLGHMVVANTLRNPGLTAKMTTTLDHVSGGRMILGLGAGWFAREHEAFGFDFGTGFGERLDRLGEAVPLIRRLLDGETVTHEGRFYRFDEAVCAPRPVQDRVPILIGGSGPKKTLPLVARYADLWNTYGSPDELAASDAILRAACEAVGPGRAGDRAHGQRQRRDPPDPRRGGARLGGLDAQAPDAGGRGPPRRRRPGREVADALRRLADVGFAHPVLVFRTPFDLETIERLPDLRAALG